MSFKNKTISIIGLGRMGRRHIHAAQKLGMTLDKLYDPLDAAIESTKTEVDLPDSVFCRSMRDLYAGPRPDCVVIATTADSHCRLVCEAAENGVKYILVEKPMATSLADCDLMIEVCKRYGAQLAVNHQMRFMDQYIEPKQLLNSAAFGGMTSMTVVGGNFGMAMNALHYFESFRFMTDEAPVEVSAWFSSEKVPNPRGPQFEDKGGAIRISTASGKRFYLDVGTDQGHGVQVIYGARNGLIAVDELMGKVRAVCRQEEYAELPTTRYGMPATEREFQIKAAEVIDSTAAVLHALLSGQNSVDPQQGRQAIAVLAAGYLSAENGGVPIRLSQELSRDRSFPWA